MKKSLEQLFKSAAVYNMTSAEREAIRLRLFAYLDTNPKILTEKTKAGQPLVSPLSRQYRLRSFMHFGYRAVSVALLIALVVGSSVSWAAEGSLPGDVLYSIKTAVNEPVGSLLAVSSSSKAKWHVQLATRRLEEAEQLAVQGKLTPQNGALLASNFKAQTEVASDTIKTLTGEGDQTTEAVEISSDLESSLRTHVKVLTALSSTATSVAPLAVEAEQTANAIAKNRIEYEKEVIITNNQIALEAATNKAKEAETIYSDVSGLLGTTTASTSSDVLKKVQAEVQQARDTIDTGNQELATGAYGQAFVQFQNAERLMDQVKLLFETTADLKANADPDASSTPILLELTATSTVKTATTTSTSTPTDKIRATNSLNLNFGF